MYQRAIGKSRYLWMFLCALILSLPGTAQKDFRKGYIIGLDNDTVAGYIDYRGDIRNAKMCIFKKNPADNPQTFLPFDIKAYRFEDGKFYVSKYVPENNQEQKKGVFTEYLVDGIINLYYYRDIYGDHYLLEKENGDLFELTNEKRIIYKDGTKYIKDFKEYIGVLKAALRDCPTIFPEIERAEFNDKSLIKITEDYHNQVCEDGKCIVYRKQLPVIHFSPGLYAGYQLTFLRFTESGNKFFSLLDVSPGQAVTPGINVYISLPKVNEKISLLLSVAYLNTSFYSNKTFPPIYSTTSYYEVNLNYTALITSGLFTYSYPFGKIRPEFSLGPTASITLDESAGIIRENEWNNIITTDSYTLYPFSNVYLGLTINTGVKTVLFKKNPIHLYISYAYLNGFEPRGGVVAELTYTKFHTLSFHTSFNF